MLTNEEFRLFRNLIYEESGIYLKESRKDFLENRLAKRMNATGASSPYWYYRLLTEKRRAEELLPLLDLLTVNETSFFRNRPQMELFKNVALPDIKRKNSAEPHKNLRIWSAGCSTGEEPYTIAMIVLDAMSNAPYNPPSSPLKLRGEQRGVTVGGRGSYDGGFDWDIKIYASDLSMGVLETANRGEYAKDKVLATTDEYYINKYFEKAPPEGNNPLNPPFLRGNHHYRVKDIIRKMIVFDFHNLKNDNGLRDLDVIFCRNVMIYFDADEQKRLINKFYGSLKPGGYLFLGHAESLQGLGTGFQFIYENMGTAYKRPVEELCTKY